MTGFIPILVSLAIQSSSATPGQADPLHLVFWQARDIRDGQNIRFQAHPFTDQDRTVLLPADPQHPALWYMPAAVIRAGDDLRVYYQRVEKSLPESRDQRTLCMGVLKGEELTLPDLKFFPAPLGWTGQRRTPTIATPTDMGRIQRPPNGP